MKNIEVMKRKVAKSIRRAVRHFKQGDKLELFKMNFTRFTHNYSATGINKRYTRAVPENHTYSATGKTGDYKY